MKYKLTPWGIRGRRANIRIQLDTDDIATMLGTTPEYTRKLIQQGKILTKSTDLANLMELLEHMER